MGDEIRVFLVCTVPLAILLWMIWPSKRGARSRSEGSVAGKTAGQATYDEPQHSQRIGVGTGLMGGEIEDAAITRFAMKRTPKDPNSSDARDLGNALGAQQSMDFLDP